MQSRTIRGAQTGSFTIPANGRIPMGVQGEFIRCLVASQQFFVSVNGGGEMYFDAGIQYAVPAMESYESFALINNTGTPITVTMAWGWGEFADGRLSVATSLKVENVAGTKLDVTDMDNVHARLQNISTMSNNLNASLRDHVSARALPTSLIGASFAEATNTTLIVVAAASNTNGIRIRHAMMVGYYENGSLWIKVGSNNLVKFTTLSTTGYGPRSHSVRDILIPAGVALEIGSTGTSNNVSIYYEVL